LLHVYATSSDIAKYGQIIEPKMNTSRSIIVGTAGHIDHGKTALVRSLTGVDADRLPEEKRRGITIDIGFADLDLGDVRVGFIDVPGHERFVKNMLAGAHGIDLVLLVIAADESVMPQTREHFDICRLLDVRAGLIVLTKKDLVDEEMLKIVASEAEDLVSGSFLEGAPIVSVSSRTGEGLEELKDHLRQISLRIPSRANNLITRLPVDRAFSMSGFGAVVTGTLTSGEISEEDELELLPNNIQVRVRGLQVHGTKVKRAFAGQRTAVNLVGVDRASIERGMVLAPVGRLHPTQIIDAQVQLLSDAPRALRSRQRVRVHAGAAEILGRAKVLDLTGEIGPGASGFAQLRLEAPIVAVFGDRFIIRSYSPQRTIGGGVIIDAFASKHRARDLTVTSARLANLLTADHARQAELFTEAAGEAGLKTSELIARTGWHDEVAKEAIETAQELGRIVVVGKELFKPSLFEDLKQRVMTDVAAHHAAEPLSRGLSKEILRGRHFSRATPDLFQAIVSDLEKEGALAVEKDIVRQQKHTRELAGADAQLRDRLNEIYREAKLAPPSLNEAFMQAGVSAANRARARQLLQILIDTGIIVSVEGEMFFHQGALNDLIAKLQAYADNKKENRSIDVATFKELAGISRKYAIPLLEYLDRRHVTRREGDRRIIL